jgi:4-hydroxybenzoate polyprenyltransferase
VSRARAWLRCFRAPLAPTAAADSTACLLLALAAAGRGPGSVALVDWLLLAATSVLVYAFGMGANDLADRERDRASAPDRPLPSGAIRPRTVAVVLALVAFGALWLGGGPSAERWAVRGALVLAALYDFFLKGSLVAGALAMGSVRFANASAAVWPLVLSGAAPPLVLAGPVAVGIYSAAVTVLSTTEETPSPARLRVSRLVAAAAFALAAVAARRAAGAPPAVGIALAAAAVGNALLGRSPRPGPAKTQVREMLLGLYFLAAVIGSAADGGSLAWGFGLLAGAFLLILGSQLAMRALAPRR